MKQLQQRGNFERDSCFLEICFLIRVFKNITDNYFAIKTGNEIIEAKNKQVISTKEGLRQAIARMRIGEATYLDVLEANRLKTQARIELISSIVNYNKNQIKQMFTIGNISLFDIKDKYTKAFK